MANSHTATDPILNRYGYTSDNKKSIYVKVDWTADSTATSPEDFTGIAMPGGFLVNLITKVGGTAPTAYKVLLMSPYDTSLDILGGAVTDRSTSATEVVQPVRSGEATPVFVSKGSYTMRITGNTNDSATGTIWFEFVEAN
jgi:hypothetical protein